MFGIGGTELFLILLFGFLIVGPDKLPELAKTVGKAIAKFRNAQDEMSNIIKKSDVYDPESSEPFKNPLDALDKASAALSKKDSMAKSAAGKPVASPSPGVDDAKKAETFSERKARYDRERAAKKAAEKAAAEQEAASAAAAASAAVKAGDRPAPVEKKIEAVEDSAGGAAASKSPAASQVPAADGADVSAGKEA